MKFAIMFDDKVFSSWAYKDKDSDFIQEEHMNECMCFNRSSHVMDIIECTFSESKYSGLNIDQILIEFWSNVPVKEYLNL